MRVSVLTASSSRLAGGLLGAVRGQSRAIQAAGCAVDVFAVEDALSAVDRPDWSGLHLELFARYGPAAFGYAPGLVSALRRSAADVLHVHGLWMFPSLAARFWAQQAGGPVVISPHGMLDPWAVRHSRLKKSMAGWLYQNAQLRRAACLHALTESEARAIRDYGLRNPICIIPNGSELPVQTDPEGPAPWTNAVPGGDPVLLYLGRLHPKKNLIALIDAWAVAMQRGAVRGWHLVIAGWGQNGYESALKKRVRVLGIGHRIHFTGPLFGSAKAAALRHAKGFVLPSVSEGQPMAVLDAWAYGLPVLMTDDCNLPEGFHCGAAMRLPWEAAAMPAVLGAFVEQGSGALSDMGIRGRRLVEGHFTWAEVGRKIVEVYRWVRRGGPTPPTIFCS